VVRRFDSSPRARPSVSGVTAGAQQTAGRLLMEAADRREPALTPLSGPESRDARADVPSSASTTRIYSDRSLPSIPAAPSILSPERPEPFDPRGQVAGDHVMVPLSKPPRMVSDNPVSRSRLGASFSGSGTGAPQSGGSDTVGRHPQQYESASVWPGRPSFRLSSPSIDRAWTRAPGSGLVRGRSTDSPDLIRSRPSTGWAGRAPLSALDRSTRAPRWSPAHPPSARVVDTLAGGDRGGDEDRSLSAGSTIGSVGTTASIRARDAHGPGRLSSAGGGSLATRPHAPLGSSRGSNGVPSVTGAPSQRWGTEPTTVSASSDPPAATPNLVTRSKPGASTARDTAVGERSTPGIAVEQTTTGASAAPAGDLVPTLGLPPTERPAALPETTVSGPATVRSLVRAHDRQRGTLGVEDRPAAWPRPSVSSGQPVGDRFRPNPRSGVVGPSTPAQSGTHNRPRSVSPHPRRGSVARRLATPPLRYSPTASRSGTETPESPPVPTQPAAAAGRRHPETAPAADRSTPDSTFGRPQADSAPTSAEQGAGGRSLSQSGQAADHRRHIDGRPASVRSWQGTDNSGAPHRHAGHAGSDGDRAGSDDVARAAPTVVDDAGHGTGPDASSWLPSTAALWTGERLMRPDFGCDIHDHVFSAVTPATLNLIESSVREALVRWEPRIDVESIDADTAENPNEVLIEIEYRVRTTNSLSNMVYPFYITEGDG